MTRSKTIFISLAFAVSASSIAKQPSPSTRGFHGRYFIDEIVGYEQVSGGIPEAKRLLGKTLVISANSIDFDGDDCKPDGGFKISEIETGTALLKIYGLNYLDAGLPAKTLLLNSDECSPVFRVNKYQILFGWNGVVVRAIRDDMQQRGKTRGTAVKIKK